jgi:hypothetical protein
MLSYGIILSCTPNHLIYVYRKGWKPLWNIGNGEQVVGLRSKVSGTEELNIGAISEAKTKHPVGTFCHSLMAIEQRVFPYCIEPYGKIISGRSRMVISSITKTEILRIMTSRTLNACQELSMDFSIADRTWKENEGKWIMQESMHHYGMEARRGLHGIANTERRYGRTDLKNMPSSVLNVEDHLSPIYYEKGHVFAQDHVFLNTMSLSNAIMKPDFVQYAKNHSQLKSQKNSQYVLVDVLGKSEGRVEAVYNLQVEDIPEYFANGILVHNCVWALSSLMFSATPGFFIAGGGRSEPQEPREQEEEKNPVHAGEAGDTGQAESAGIPADPKPVEGPAVAPKTKRDRAMERWLRGD